MCNFVYALKIKEQFRVRQTFLNNENELDFYFEKGVTFSGIRVPAFFGGVRRLTVGC